MRYKPAGQGLRLACWHAACPRIVVLDDRQRKKNRRNAAPQVLGNSCSVHGIFITLFSWPLVQADSGEL